MKFLKAWARSALVALTLGFGMVTVSVPAFADDEQLTWTGTWEVRSLHSGAQMKLVQEDRHVEGTYQPYDGWLEGEVRDNRLIGRWTEQAREGSVVMTMAPDGKSFMGRLDGADWITGSRVDLTNQLPQQLIDLSTPRATLRSFLIAAQRFQIGLYSAVAPALATIEIGPQMEALTQRERIDYIETLFRVIDQTTFRLQDLPGRRARGEEVRVLLRQAGTHVFFELEFRRHGDAAWLIVPPSRPALAAKLDELIEARDGVAAAPDDHLQLRHARATMRTFMENVKRLDQGGLDRVMATMDLSDIHPSVRAFEARRDALYLRSVLDRVSFIIYQEIPNDPDSRVPYVHFEHPRGDIVISPVSQEEGVAWQFTGETLASLRDLYVALEDVPLVQGLTPYADQPLLFRLRDRLESISPFLLQRTWRLENWQWLGLGLVLLFGVAVAGGVAWLTARFLRWRLDGRGSGRDAQLQSRLLWPVRITFMALTWFVGVHFLNVPEGAYEILNTATTTLIAVGAVWAAYTLTDILASYFHQRARRSSSSVDEIVVSLLGVVVKMVVVIVGVLLLAEALALPYQGVLAGLGIFGFGFALAARETIVNFFGTAALLADRPFRRGDWITIGDQEGTVEHVGIRTTRIRALDDSVIVIPNGALAGEKIGNLGRRRSRLLKTCISVTYETPPDRLDAFTTALRDMIKQRSEIRRDRLQIGVWAFAESSIDLELVCYLDVNSAEQEREVRHTLLLDIVRLADEMAIEFALPARTMRVRPEQAEVPPRLGLAAS